jgi:hypothetical protein
MPAPRRSDTPKPGFYLLRVVRGGPWVGASISFDADAGWSVMLDGETQGPSLDPWSLPNMERVHWGGRESTEAEVVYRIGLKRWAEIHKPDHHAANPRKAISLDDLIPF